MNKLLFLLLLFCSLGSFAQDLTVEEAEGLKTFESAVQEVNDSEALKKAPTLEEKKFSQFINRLIEDKPSTEAKTEVLQKVASADPESLQQVHLLYYNVESDLIGYPHLKMIVGGKVYEIHRIPNKDGGFLRENPLVRGLLDARKGYLPSGIVSFPVSQAQQASIVDFLKKESGPDMRYAFFNKMLDKDTYNCGGILYQALRESGLPIPAMTKFNSALPGQLFRRVLKNVPEARLVGVGRHWVDEIVKPNWSRYSIPGAVPPAGVKQEKVGCALGTICFCIKTNMRKYISGLKTN